MLDSEIVKARWSVCSPESISSYHPLILGKYCQNLLPSNHRLVSPSHILELALLPVLVVDPDGVLSPLDGVVSQLSESRERI